MMLVSTEEEEEEGLDSVLVNIVPMSMDLVSTVQILVMSTDLVLILVTSTDLAQILASTVLASIVSARTDLAVTLVLHLDSTVQSLASTVPVSTELVPVTRSTQKKEPHNQTVNTRAAVLTESIHFHSSAVERNHHCTLGALHRGALVRHRKPVALYHDMVVDSHYCCRQVVVVLPHKSNTGPEWVVHGFDHVVATTLVTVPTK